MRFGGDMVAPRLAVQTGRFVKEKNVDMNDAHSTGSCSGETTSSCSVATTDTTRTSAAASTTTTSTSPVHDIPVSSSPPCTHNTWLRMRRPRKLLGGILLRCVVCSTTWATMKDMHTKCQAFYHGTCSLGGDCPHPHIFAKGTEHVAEEMQAGTAVQPALRDVKADTKGARRRGSGKRRGAAVHCEEGMNVSMEQLACGLQRRDGGSPARREEVAEKVVVEVPGGNVAASGCGHASSAPTPSLTYTHNPYAMPEMPYGVFQRASSWPKY